ncbi:MAG: hypothetical protein LCH83_01055 [Proteobacteria bacterium]|nr:hypothetical protein [Pseudomonadota bacterium]
MTLRTVSLPLGFRIFPKQSLQELPSLCLLLVHHAQASFRQLGRAHIYNPKVLETPRSHFWRVRSFYEL